MRVVIKWLGFIAVWTMLGPLGLMIGLLLLPVIVIFWAMDEVLRLVRHEPRIRLPDTGFSLLAEGDAEANPAVITEAIISRCTGNVTTVAPEGGAVQLTSDAAPDRRVVIRTSEDPDPEDCLVIDIGPWSVDSPEGIQLGEGDAAVAMAVAYLEHGLTCRVVKGRTVGLLWLADPGVWWRSTADGGGTFLRPGSAIFRADLRPRKSVHGTSRRRELPRMTRHMMSSSPHAPAKNMTQPWGALRRPP